MNIESTPPLGSTLSAHLDDLITLSRRFGEDPEFARGGGGNSSVKVDGVLYIKPSGTSLASLTPELVIALDVERLLEFLDRPNDRPVVGGTDEVMRVALEARVGPPDDRRPSVELLFHALLPERFVLHTHPTTVNALTCARLGAETAAQLFGPKVLWVPYADPGLPLAHAIRDARRTHEARTGTAAPGAMFLQNHGLIVAGETLAEIEETSTLLVTAIRDHLANLPPMPWGEVGRLEVDRARAALRAVGPALRLSSPGAIDSRSSLSTTRRSLSPWQGRRSDTNSPSVAR